MAEPMPTSPVSSQGPYTAIIFPADGRSPHLDDVPTSTAGPNYYNYEVLAPQVSVVPHPELLMDHVAEGFGAGACQCQHVEALDGMNSKLEQPFGIFYPVAPRPGMNFPVNQCVREIQQGRGMKGNPWRGDLVVVKYSDYTYNMLVPAKMSDFPIIKNYLLTHEGPY